MPEKNQQTPETENSAQVRGTVENKAPKPAGLLPKNTQQLVILSVAVVMVLIMWLTGGTKRASTSTAGVAPGARVQPPNPATVEDFKQTIQQEQAAARQPISPNDLARLQSMGLAGDVPPGVVAPPDDGVPQPGAVLGGTTAQPPPADPVKEDRKKREYLSLFAPNVAFTYRNGPERDQLTGKQTAATATRTDAPRRRAQTSMPRSARLRLSSRQRDQTRRLCRRPTRKNRKQRKHTLQTPMSRRRAHSIPTPGSGTSSLRERFSKPCSSTASTEPSPAPWTVW